MRTDPDQNSLNSAADRETTADGGDAARAGGGEVPRGTHDGALPPSSGGSADIRESEDPLIGQVVADRYRIVELLGRGGMGAVYRADHVLIKKSFALKVLHPELTHHTEAVRRFEREAIAAARIDHPNVATAIDFGNLPTGEFFLVLDYVQGQSLRALLEQEGTLSELRTVRIARQIASALAAAHQASIVHRDLKPDNVMLVEGSTESDFVKVLDFGIAKLRTEDIAEEPAITRFGTIFGTPEYMSPEQALGQSVDARSDLYSLGIMIYEMLSGRTPFADEQLVTVLSRHMTDAPAPLANVTPDLSRVFMQLLEKRPESRPASAEQLVQKLDAIPVVGMQGAAFAMPASAQMQALATTETVLALAGSVRAFAAEHLAAKTAEQQLIRSAEPSPQFSLPPWMKRQVTVAGRPLPWVLIAVASGLIVVTITLTLTVGSFFAPGSADTGASATAGPMPETAAKSEAERQIAEWITKASSGDTAALSALEARSEASRTATEWGAIGAGRIHAKRFIEAIDAYAKALAADARVGANPQTAADLYQAALVPESSEQSWKLALNYLGEKGPDLLYAVQEAAANGRAPKIDRKKLRTLADLPDFNRQASESLKLANELAQGKSCQEYRSLLPKAKLYADARSLASLRKLTHDRGCGLLGLRDCYACLRSARTLNDAIDAAKSRPAPSF